MRKKWIIACALLLAAMAVASGAAAECKDKHSFGPYRTKRSATCRQTGLQFRYCRNCDHWEKRELSKLPHTPDEWVVTQEPTCVKRGIEQATCTACGDRIKRYIDMLPHAYGEMTIAKEPTCTANGQGVYVCAGCGRKKNETIPKLGHDWTNVRVIKEATCKAAGSAEQACARCGRTRTGKLDPLAHVWGEWTVTKAPSGAARGTREHVCTLCGLIKSERFFEEGTLYEDMTPCEEVVRMQEMLRDLGYYEGSIRSGKFGPQTGKAVARFQKKYGLQESGVADPQTLQRIQEAWEAQNGQR